MRRIPVVAGLLVGLLAAWGAPAAAQTEADPLRKSDLIRLLAATPAAQVADVVRTRCLSFQPTPRDLEDLRAMGAGPAVMDAISACLAGSAGETAGATDAGAGEDRSELTLFLDPRQLRVRPGESASIRVEVTGGAIPASGVRLELVDAESGAVLEESTTGREGAVRFDLPTGTSPPGTRRFRVVAPDRELYGASEVEVEVTPEAPPTGNAGEAERGERGATVTLERADRLSREGRYGQAERLYRALLDADPERVDVLLAYGLHLSRTGAHAEAERMLRRARLIDPERADVSRALGMVSLWRGAPEEAVRWLRAAVDATPTDAEAWRALGRALRLAGRTEEAREAFSRAESLRPTGDTPLRR